MQVLWSDSVEETYWYTTHGVANEDASGVTNQVHDVKQQLNACGVWEACAWGWRWKAPPTSSSYRVRAWYESWIWECKGNITGTSNNETVSLDEQPQCHHRTKFWSMMSQINDWRIETWCASNHVLFFTCELKTDQPLRMMHEVKAWVRRNIWMIDGNGSEQCHPLYSTPQIWQTPI